ncbi:hypothetical protein AV530_008591 [Patagioenas fasciata monilis]|uniref:Uncharacterized protein n=1 Tax=Patagioenas fasciata monilis TaxID=372326 RepID=A0A1V4L0F3_PATFA|nr:hypothetical protein AV530_008591 [Patagioenas fasciata monilis]
MKINCSAVQFLMQIVVSLMDTGTSCHSICFLTDCLCKISFSKNQEKSQALPSEIVTEGNVASLQLWIVGRFEAII